MRRAAILIGVGTTGGLPALQAVGSGLQQMRVWAETQGMKQENGRLVVFSDADGQKVRSHQVAETIAALVEKRNLEQLIVYFTGHGVYNRGDIWLLSGAPTLSSEAVNVEGSIQAARGCGVRHVVLISDACRTAAEGIAGLEVKGGDIFPNNPVDGLERPVDSYFACARGKPALEIRDPLEAARGFSGVYTEVLSECLMGRHAGILDVGLEDGVTTARVGAWKLADHLVAEVPRRIKARLRKSPSLNQTPVGRITSRDGWVSRLAPYQPSPHANAEVDVLGAGVPHEMSAVEAADRMLDEVLGGTTWRSGEGLLGDHDRSSSWASQLAATAADFAKPFRPLPAGTGMPPSRTMFRLRGEKASALHAPPGIGTVAELPGQAGFGIGEIAGPGNVVLVLSNGRCVLLPAVPGWTAELDFKPNELVHLAFLEADPQDRSSAHARRLLGAVAAAANLGVLRLTDELVQRLAAAVDAAGRLDPSLALYLAYAYHDRGERARIGELHARLLREQGITLFDVALLAGGDHLATAQRTHAVFPPVPAMSRGWSLLEAFHARLPAALSELEAYLRPSVWTLFSGAARDRLIALVHEGRQGR